MKKTVSIFILIIMLLSISACNKTANPVESPDVTPKESASPAGHITTEPSPAPTQAVLELSEEDFPRIDGSTANIPLGIAVYSTLLGKTVTQEDIGFSGTSSAWSNLYYENTDLLLVYEPSRESYGWLDELEPFEYAPIGRDALVFLVNAENDMDNLSTEQIKDIYSGKITNWKALGGNDGEIAAYQRNSTSGSQAMMNKLVIPETEMTVPPSTYIIGGMEELIKAVSGYNNAANSIGYNVFYYVTQMKNDKNIKILNIDGIEPDKNSIQNGNYPFVNDFFVAIRKNEPEGSPARKIYEWMQSPEGQGLVESSGYVPVSSPNKDGNIGNIVFKLDEIGGRFYQEHTTSLKPGEDYGVLYPYIGMYAEWSPVFGLCTAEGEIVVDPVYNQVEIAERNGKSMYLLQRFMPDEHNEYEHKSETTFAALDGSWAVTYEDCETRVLDYNYEYHGVLPDSDYISVYDGNGWGAIDYEGHEVYPCKEKLPVIFCEGLAAVWNEDNSQYSYINLKGEKILGPYDEDYAPSYNQNVFFSNGLALFLKDGMGGYIDKNGKVVIEAEYESAMPFYGSYAKVSGGVIGKNGEMILTFENPWEGITPVDEESFVTEGKLINIDGESLELPFYVYEVFPEGRFLTESGIVDKTGKLLFDLGGGASALPSGRITALEETGWGIWDVDLKPLLPPKYTVIFEFEDYYAVREGNYGGLVDKKGDWIIKRSLLDYLDD